MTCRRSRDASAIAWLAVVVWASAWTSSTAAADAVRPDLLVLTVDTLRTDRVSAYGYHRETTPNVDRLLSSGVRFDEARTPEPLTAPALVSMWTGRAPHEHGATRNGLRMRPDFPSTSKTLRDAGYVTAAFVGNWTLRDPLSGLGEHFEHFEEVLTRKRWFGLIRGEATADDLNETALAWLDERFPDGLVARDRPPVLLWIHYVEPHAPYRYRKDEAERLGLGGRRDTSKSDRYDTEVAFVDRAIGELLDRLERAGGLREPVVVFASDHGESLGEHDYWGHGRNLHEPSLHIPLGIVWNERVDPGTVDAPALLQDVAPTLLGLVGVERPGSIGGHDWSGVLLGDASPPTDRVTTYQAHKGAVISRHESELARKAGLIAIARIAGTHKEIFRTKENRLGVYDLASDPGELDSNVEPRATPSAPLEDWMRAVFEGLDRESDAPPRPLDEESIEQLRSLGYVD